MEMTVMNGFSLKKTLNPQVLALGLTCSFMTTIAFANTELSNEDNLFEKGKINETLVDKKAGPDLSDGSYLRGLPMTRDLILDSYNNFQSFDYSFEQAGSKGSKKIFSIKPTGDTKPRAVILLNKKIHRRLKGTWFPKLDLTISRKNITLCEGFMTLPRATAESFAIRKNEVITFMPVLGENTNNIPQSPEYCRELLENNYDYDSAKEELDFVLTGFNKEKSPYLAVYESDKSPYSSMILSLGELSPESIKILSKDWSELIIKVYENGDSIDPTVAMATMLSFDPKLQQAQQDSNWKNISFVTREATCEGSIAASSVISLGTFMSTRMCRDAVKEAAYAMGYTVPSFLKT